MESLREKGWLGLSAPAEVSETAMSAWERVWPLFSPAVTEDEAEGRRSATRTWAREGAAGTSMETVTAPEARAAARVRGSLGARAARAIS